MNLEYIVQEIDNKDLSLESAEKTKDLLNYMSDKIRQEYDIAKRLLTDKEAVKKLLETKQVETAKELIQMITDGKLTIILNETKQRFTHLLNVQA